MLKELKFSPNMYEQDLGEYAWKEILLVLDQGGQNLN